MFSQISEFPSFILLNESLFYIYMCVYIYIIFDLSILFFFFWGVARILEWIPIPFSRKSFPTQRPNPGVPHCRQTLYRLSHQGSLYINIYKYIFLLSIHLSLSSLSSGSLSCIQMLTIVNNAAMNMGVEMTFQIPDFIFLNIYSKARLHNTMVLFLIAWKTSLMFTVVTEKIIFPLIG